MFKLAKTDIFNSISLDDIFAAKLSITEDLLKQFGTLSGDLNPIHTDDNYAKEKGFLGKVCYGNILGMLISTMVGMNLGSNEVMLLSQKVDFRYPVYVGDVIELKGKVSNKSEAVRIIELKLSFWNEKGMKVASGKCQVRCF